MGRQLALILTAWAMAATAAPAQSTTAPFYSATEMRAMCRGESAEAAQFQTEAAQRLLAQTYRTQCRYYLLGAAEGYLRALGDAPAQPRCLPEIGDRDGLADALTAAVLQSGGDASVAEIVRGVLRTRYRCT